MSAILTPSPVIAPPFTLESAIRKVRAAEDAWNSRDPDRVVLAYTEDSVWRNRIEFPVGREEIRRFLAGKWDRELDYRLVKGLWAFTADRIAVKFEYEWHDARGPLGPQLRQRAVGVRRPGADATSGGEHQRSPDCRIRPQVLLARARPPAGGPSRPRLTDLTADRDGSPQIHGSPGEERI